LTEIFQICFLTVGDNDERSFRNVSDGEHGSIIREYVDQGIKNDCSKYEDVSTVIDRDINNSGLVVSGIYVTENNAFWEFL
jgi:hypothetical protein